jgi:hypothetical protein
MSNKNQAEMINDGDELENLESQLIRCVFEELTRIKSDSLQVDGFQRAIKKVNWTL